MQREQQRQAQRKIRSNQRKQKEVYDRWGVGSGQSGSKGSNVRMNVRKLIDGGGGGGEKRSKGATARRPMVPEYGANCFYSCWEEHRMDIDRDDEAEDEALALQMRELEIEEKKRRDEWKEELDRQMYEEEPDWVYESEWEEDDPRWERREVCFVRFTHQQKTSSICIQNPSPYNSIQLSNFYFSIV